jgi:hypothetical protein
MVRTSTPPCIRAYSDIDPRPRDLRPKQALLYSVYLNSLSRSVRVKELASDLIGQWMICRDTPDTLFIHSCICAYPDKPSERDALLCGNLAPSRGSDWGG